MRLIGLLVLLLPVYAVEYCQAGYKLDDRYEFDLSPLNRDFVINQEQDTPPTKEKREYRINICSPIQKLEVADEDRCPDNTYVCYRIINVKKDDERVTRVIPISTDNNGALKASFAVDPSTDDATKNDAQFRLVLNGGNDGTKDQLTNITMQCDESGDRENPVGPEFVSYDGGMLNLKWKTPFVCAKTGDDGSGGGGGGGGLGWFSILLIILVCLLASYFILGAIYNYKMYNARGMDLLPHRDFWQDLPGILRDLLNHVVDSVSNRSRVMEGNEATTSEEVSALQNEIKELKASREADSRKEKEVMRGLVSKIQKLTEEKNQLAQSIEEAKAGAQDAEKEDKVDYKQQVSELTQQLQNVQLHLDNVRKQAPQANGTLPANGVATDGVNVEALKADLENKGNQVSELNAKIDALQTSITALTEQGRTAADKHRSEVEQLVREKAELKENLKSAQAAKDELAKLKEVHGQMETDYIALNKSKTEALEKLADAQSSVRNLTTRLNEAQEATKNTKEMEAELATLRKTHEEEEDKMKKYINVLNKTKKQILKLEKEKSDMSGDLTNLQQQHATVVQELQQAREQLLGIESTHQSALDGERQRLQGQISSMTTELATLRANLTDIRQEKELQYEELQTKQAEYESSQSRVETFEHQIKEYTRELNESNERIVDLEDQLKRNQKAAAERDRELAQRADRYSAMEKDYEQRLKAIQDELDQIRSSQNGFDEVKQGLQEKLESSRKEIEELTSERQRVRDDLSEARRRIQASEDEIDTLKHQADNLKEDAEAKEASVKKLEHELKIVQQRVEELNQDISTKDQALEEAKMRESHLKTLNKFAAQTLKDEVRKISRPLQVEKPSFDNSRPQSPSINSDTPPSHTPSPRPNRVMSPPSTPTLHPYTREDEINLEYLRHVLLKFLENKATRPQLVPVIATIMKFTPDEAKRLQNVQDK
ncbi:hypothetical protein BZG36_03975 [Bifiguratus adelaidae]|uniref:Autophagy-related protein 27 n=1 Tax=Bifiguratus adelaidae TaxID=1938954 RepID=A0A261XXB9_9FUNG|nr:hypothetical protein BZG36_03975 [Bifiguratus adelaidae]